MIAILLLFVVALLFVVGFFATVTAWVLVQTFKDFLPQSVYHKEEDVNYG